MEGMNKWRIERDTPEQLRFGQAVDALAHTSRRQLNTYFNTHV